MKSLFLVMFSKCFSQAMHNAGQRAFINVLSHFFVCVRSLFKPYHIKKVTHKSEQPPKILCQEIYNLDSCTFTLASQVKVTRLNVGCPQKEE